MPRKYHVGEVVGDRYSAEWCAQTFQKFGIQYRASEKSRSEIYLEFLPAVMSSSVELLDNARLKNQLASLERVTGRQRDVIDHPPGGHDDVSNAVRGCLVLVCADSGVFGLLEFDVKLRCSKIDKRTHKLFSGSGRKLRTARATRFLSPVSRRAGIILPVPHARSAAARRSRFSCTTIVACSAARCFSRVLDRQYVSNRIDLAEGRVVDSKIFGKLGRG